MAKRGGLLREFGENRLGGVLRQRAIQRHAQRDKIYEIRLPPHDFGKSRLVAQFDVLAEQFAVGFHRRRSI
jgi:hypothetical protein